VSRLKKATNSVTITSNTKVFTCIRAWASSILPI